ncbi:hypothetical protein D918_02487, partial [Trichuris suis]
LYFQLSFCAVASCRLQSKYDLPRPDSLASVGRYIKTGSQSYIKHTRFPYSSRPGRPPKRSNYDSVYQTQMKRPTLMPSPEIYATNSAIGANKKLNLNDGEQFAIFVSVARR